jgi:hypothetical protein
MSNDGCSCSQTGTAKMGIPKAEKAADRLLQKLKGVTIDRATLFKYRKIISTATITEGLIHSKDDDGDADDAADDGAVGAVKLSLKTLNQLNDLSKGAPVAAW